MSTAEATGRPPSVGSKRRLTSALEGITPERIREIGASYGINLSGIVKANAIGVEGFTTPTRDIVFNWSSLPMAADSAGLSRRVGGIHFTRGDYAGRDLGRAAGGRVLARLRALFEGRTAY